MEAIKTNYSKIHGYNPTNEEILDLYLQGELTLTDKQENEILKYFNL